MGFSEFIWNYLPYIYVVYPPFFMGIRSSKIIRRFLILSTINWFHGLL